VVVQGPTVLVVDDDSVSRHVLMRALSEAGIGAVAVEDGAQALAKVAGPLPSLILLDLVMPPPDGYQVLRALRSMPSTREIPVVVLTSLDSEEEVARAFGAGADDFVRKPFRADELVARIRGQLRLRGYIDELARKERDTQVVLELTQALASSLDLREILFTVVRRIAEVAHVDRCSIVVAEGGGGEFGFVAATSDDHQLHDLRIRLDRYPEILQVMHSGEPLVIENTANHPLLDGVRDDISTHSVRSLAILPINYEYRPMGVLFLRAKQQVAIGEHELSVARTVANATAIALRNARVVQRLKDKSERAQSKAERRLRMLRRYAAFFESAADGILVMDLDGQILFSNARAREITGFGESVLRGSKVDDLIWPQDREKLGAVRAAVAASATTQSADLHLRQPSGNEIILSVNINSVLREDNAVLLNFRDVTRERMVDAELKTTKEFLERVIDSSANGILSFDRERVVRLFNRASERCFGYRADQVIAQLKAEHLFPAQGAEEVLRLVHSSGKERYRRIEDHRTQVVSSSNELVPVSLSAALIVEEGTSEGAVVVFTDLRDRLHMEERLAAAQEELQSREKQAIIAELAGAAAHELNQPLTSVMGYAEMLKRKLGRDSEAFSAAEVIINEAERMAEIVRKIGKITRYETKTYVGAARILDLDRASEERPPEPRR
jgi:PAS domain S-box-containing protein